MSAILDFVSSWQTAHIDAWAFSILNPLGVGKWVPAMAGKV